MTPETVIDVGMQAMKVTALLAAPLLLSALVVGLLVGMFQAAMLGFTIGLIEGIPDMIG